MTAARLRIDQPVDVREEGGRVIIEPMHEAVFDLGALVAQIRLENRHDEYDFGGAVGREAL